MAHSLLDSARLDDDALMAWYQRPTEEIQRTRQLADAARFADLGVRARQEDGGTPASNPSDTDPAHRRPASAYSSTRFHNGSAFVARREGVSSPATRPFGGVPVARAALERGLQRSAAGAASRSRATRDRGAQPTSSSTICRACHGTSMPPPPPSFAVPWGVPPESPWKQPPYSRPQGPREHPPQCAMQNMADSRKCVRQPNKVAREMCWETAAKREAYCIESKGEVGYPSLFTHD